jgi:hypothetical protein
VKRSLPLAAAAVLSLTVLVAPAGPASAAAHGHGRHTAHHATKAHGHATKAQTKLDHQRRGTGQAIAQQLRQVDRLVQLAGTSAQVSDADRAALLTALQADDSALAAVRTGLVGATTHHDLVAALHQAILIRSTARQQLRIAIAVAQVSNQASALTASAQGLQTQVDDASGQDTTATDASLADLGQQVAAASAAADDAVAKILAVTPGATRAQLITAAEAARADLAAAAVALGAAEQDLLAVQQDVAAWSAPTP